MTRSDIKFEREVILRKVRRTPDARYKTGYKPAQVLAETRAIIGDDVVGTQLAQSHIHQIRREFTATEVFGDVTFAISVRETKL